MHICTKYRTFIEHSLFARHFAVHLTHTVSSNPQPTFIPALKMGRLRLANMWWKLGSEPRSDLTLKPELLTLLHIAPGLIILTDTWIPAKSSPNRPWPGSCSYYVFSQSEGSFDPTGWSSTLPQRGKGGKSCSLLPW